MGEPDLSPIYPEVEKMAILEEETYRRFGYYPRDLKPQSHKRILAACDKCGKIRETSKNHYCALCRSCPRKGTHFTKETCKRLSKAHKGKHHTEETCKRMSVAKKGANNPNYGKSLTEEDRKKISETLKGRYSGKNNPMYGKHHTEETKREMRGTRKGKYAGEKSPHWRGGISFEPYCQKFNNKFKQYIRDKFGNICFLCSKTEAANGRKLSVHHVNYDKACGCAETEEERITDDNECQFVPLCISCNSKVNKDRDMWERKIKNTLRNKLNGWYI